MVSKYFSFEGRAGRAKFLQMILIAFIIVIGAWFLDERLLAANLCDLDSEFVDGCLLPGEVQEGVKLRHFAGAFVAIPLLSVMVRRLHDHGKSGWLLLISLTVVGILPLLYWLLTKSKKDVNQYN